MRIYVCGSAGSPAEIDFTNGLASTLEKSGFDVYAPRRDGPERALAEFAGGGRSYDAVCAVSLVRDIHEITERCDCLVFNMNGRVPDEGCVFRAGLAYAAGKPVVLFKDDDRAPFMGKDNSMVLGLSRDFRAVKKSSRLSGAVTDAIKEIENLGKNPYKGGNVPETVRSLAELGRKNAGVESSGEPEKPADEENEKIGDVKEAASRDGNKARVYCSGPLFCPAEKTEMSLIAGVLEADGFDTFVPHRDGVEALVMGAAGSPFLNIPPVSWGSRVVERSMFRLDIYEILERCDAIVVNLNGSVPDEGAVVEAAVAAAAGVPLVFYNSSRCSVAGGIANHVLRAAAVVFSAVGDIETIPAAIREVLPEGGRRKIECPPFVKETVEKGGKVSRMIQGFVSGNKGK